LCPLSRRYFRITHAINVGLKCRSTGDLADG
jgi:hypothetical protein